MEPGIYYELTFDDYKKIPAINKSGLDLIAVSPLHYYDAHLAPDREPREPTDDMKLGSAIHTMILEPKEFNDRYVISPEDAPKRPTKAQINAKKPSPDSIAAIEFWNKFDLEKGEREVISAEDVQICQAINNRFKSSRVVQSLFEGGKTEVTMIWKKMVDLGDGNSVEVLCKGRVDLLSHIMLDLKSAMSAQKAKFGKKASDLLYQVQAAWYSDGWSILNDGATIPFVFGAFEKKRPFACAFFLASEKNLNQGRIIYEILLQRYAKAMASGIWEGYPDSIQELILPPWAGKDIDYGTDESESDE